MQLLSRPSPVVTTTAMMMMMVVAAAAVLEAAQVNHGHAGHHVDAAFPRVSPDRRVFVDYDNVSVSCGHVGGAGEWRVMRKLDTAPSDSSTWNTSAPSRLIYPAWTVDTGQYWCENEAGQRSGAVNITVTASDVILEISPLPVTEGSDVTLHCRNKKSQSAIVDFYRDGARLAGYRSEVTLAKVSRSHEGLYSCSVSGAGRSPSVWLAVGTPTQDIFLNSSSEPLPPVGGPRRVPPVLWMSAVMLPVTLLLFSLGLHLYRRRTAASEDDDVTASQHATYATVQPGTRTEVWGGDDVNSVTYAAVEIKNESKEKKKAELSGGTGSGDNATYSLLTFQVTDT